MGSLCNESFAEFLESLKKAGVDISNEGELRERLAEVHRWRYAFMILANNGSALGIRFSESESGSDRESICNTLASYQFPAETQAAFVASLATRH